jgi:hypothetical protein
MAFEETSSKFGALIYKRGLLNRKKAGHWLGKKKFFALQTTSEFVSALSVMSSLEEELGTSRRESLLLSPYSLQYIIKPVQHCD